MLVVNQDKGYLEAFSCRAFLWGNCLPLRARYLLFQLVRLYSLGLPGKTTMGGVQRLAQDTGFSKDGVSRNLRLLVNQGALVQEQEITQGRPRTVYRLDVSLQQAPSRHWSMTHLAPWLSRILCADEPPFSALSKSERSLLALLWGQIESPRVCVLDGQSVSKLSKIAGIDSSTFYALTHQLHEKGMLVSSGAAFAADGQTNKTKTYFLLGPAVVNCWSHAFTWHVRMEAKTKEESILHWFSSCSSECNGEKLLEDVEDLARWQDIRGKLPKFWDVPGSRHYVLMQCCAALSYAFSTERTRLWDTRVLYVKIQAALLRVLGLPIADADGHRTVIEETDLTGLTDERQELYFFADQLSILLVEALRTIFPVVLYPHDLGKGVRLLSCYPVAVDGAQKLRIDLVADDEVSGAKFGAYLLSKNKSDGLELPEQLRVGPKG